MLLPGGGVGGGVGVGCLLWVLLFLLHKIWRRAGEETRRYKVRARHLGMWSEE